MPDYFGSLLHVEVSWAVFLLPLPTALALLVWWAPTGASLALRRALATASGLVTLAFLVGFAASMGNLGPGKRSLLGHAFSFARLGSFDAGLTLLVDPLSLGFSVAIALVGWVTQSRLGPSTGGPDRSDAARPMVLTWTLGAQIAVLADDMGLSLVGLGVAAIALTALVRSVSSWNTAIASEVAARPGDERDASSRTTDEPSDLRPEPRGPLHRDDVMPPESTLRALVRPSSLFLVAAAFAGLFWLSGGHFVGPVAGFTPEGLARFGSVEAKPRKSAPPTHSSGPGEEAPQGFLTMTGSPGSWLALDGNEKLLRASPFVRVPVAAGLHRARILGGAATDDVELGTFYVPPQGESYVAVVGPTSSLREARNQLRVERADAAQGKLGLRARLRDTRLIGLPPGVWAIALLALGALGAFGVFGAPLPPAHAGVGVGLAGEKDKKTVFSIPPAALLPVLVSRVVLPAYLVARAEFFSTAEPVFSAALAIGVMGLAGWAGLRASRALSTHPTMAVSGAADALALAAVAVAIAGSAGAATVLAVGGSAGIALAFGGASTKTDNSLYLPGAALLALPPLGMAAPWAIGQAVASLASTEVAAPGAAMVRAAAFALLGAATLATIAFALFRVAAPDTEETSKPAPEAAEPAGAKEKKRHKNKNKNGSENKGSAADSVADTPKRISADELRASRQPRVILAVGAVAIVLGALPLASLMSFTIPLFGWVDEGNRLRSPLPAPGLAATLLVAIAALLGHMRAKTRTIVPTDLEATAGVASDGGEDDPTDPLGPLGTALQNLRGAFATSLPAPKAADDEPTGEDDVDKKPDEIDHDADAAPDTDANTEEDK